MENKWKDGKENEMKGMGMKVRAWDGMGWNRKES
jgi:hypothetical protein